MICVKDCSASATPNSAGHNFEFLSCYCNAGYQWDYRISACASTKVCNPGYYLSNNSCVLDCLAIRYSTGVTDGAKCKCASGYRWETPIGQCVSANSNAVAIACGIAIPLCILGLLALAGLLWWCCRPAPVPVIAMPPMQSMVPMVATPVPTSSVIRPATSSQVVSSSFKATAPQTTRGPSYVTRGIPINRF